MFEAIPNVLALELKSRASIWVEDVTSMHERFYEELLKYVHCPLTLLMERVFRLLA
jgi:hypothetical protein